MITRRCAGLREGHGVRASMAMPFAPRASRQPLRCREWSGASTLGRLTSLNLGRAPNGVRPLFVRA